jgi:hypothetical protein
MSSSDLVLTPLAYDTLRRFADGEDIHTISNATGQPWMHVRNLVNIHTSGHRTKARTVLDALTPPTPEQVADAIAANKASALTAPLPDVKAKVGPPQPPPPEPPRRAVMAVTPARGTVNIDDLDTLNGVCNAARDTPHADAARQASDALAEVRRHIIADRRAAAVKTRIAELEAELKAEVAKLRDLVSAE